ncbi:MAG TPA: hypothetical protein VM030_11885 [Acidimicrobiales bacterium]|nr:hypothetical protein [Acidimicrobiales bacterium]
MVVSRRRRRRRPAWLLVGILASIIVLLVNAAASSAPRDTERRLAVASYLDAVRTQVERSTRQGADLADFRGRAVELGRATLSKRLHRVSLDAGASLKSVEAIEPPDTLRTAHSLAVATFAIRAKSAVALEKALTTALDPKSTKTPIRELVMVSEDLLAADRTYGLFVAGLPKRADTAMPESTWQRGTIMHADEAAAYVTALRSSASLQPVHDVAIVITTLDPTPVATEGESVVLPTVKTLKVHVVVANVGNDPLKRVPVVAEITGPDGKVDTARQYVDLAPGQKSTVTVGGLHLEAGGATALSIKAGPVDGEGRLADNERNKTLVLR